MNLLEKVTSIVGPLWIKVSGRFGGPRPGAVKPPEEPEADLEAERREREAGRLPWPEDK